MVEQTVPKAHQPALADGSEGLQLGEMLGPLVDIHAAQANADGAGRDNDNFVAIFPQLHCRLYYGRQDGQKRLVGLLIDNGAGPYLEGQLYKPLSDLHLLGHHSPSLMTTPSGRGDLMAAHRKNDKMSTNHPENRFLKPRRH